MHDPALPLGTCQRRKSYPSYLRKSVSKLFFPSWLHLQFYSTGSCWAPVIIFFGGVRREGLCDLRSPLGRPAGRLRLSLPRRRSRAPRSSGQVRARGSGCALARLPPPAGPTTRCPHLPSPGAALHRPHVWGAPTSPPRAPRTTPNSAPERAGLDSPKQSAAKGPSAPGGRGSADAASMAGRRAAAGAGEDHSGAARRGASRPGSMALASLRPLATAELGGRRRRRRRRAPRPSPA